jgi:antitoxin component of RelBE/YafQ-DinJ toxin-antitoxin module
VTDPNSPHDEPAGTLYDPPEGPEATSVSDDDSVGLRLRLSEEDRNRLQAVAQQLGLTPSTLAQRAIQMVCNEVVTIQEDNRSPELLVDQYQARIDLLHAVENGASSGPSLFADPGTENDAASEAEHSSRAEDISDA